MKFGFSDVLKCFEPTTVGTKVTDQAKFLELVEAAVKAHDPKKDQQEGQHYIELPDAVKLVSAGVGQHTGNPDDYIVRSWRDEVGLYLKREHAAKCSGCAVIVYTRQAYEKDPEVDKTRFLQACPTEDITHVIVAVLGFAGPKPTVGYSRFVHNLSGSNNEYNILRRLDEHMTELAAPKGGGKGMYHDSKNGFHEKVNFLTAEVKRIRQLAADVVEYNRTWCTVAD
jgi:hypothetical protein